MTYTKEIIWDKMNTDARWLKRGILAIFEFQTEDEQNADSTRYENGVGFNGVDAPFLSSIAKQLLQGKELSEKQLYCARKTMKKYSGQLANIANKKLPA